MCIQPGRERRSGTRTFDDCPRFTMSVSIQKAIRSLEADGLISGSSAGRTRVYRLEPRYFAFSGEPGRLHRPGEDATDSPGDRAGPKR